MLADPILTVPLRESSDPSLDAMLTRSDKLPVPALGVTEIQVALGEVVQSQLVWRLRLNDPPLPAAWNAVGLTTAEQFAAACEIDTD